MNGKACPAILLIAVLAFSADTVSAQREGADQTSSVRETTRVGGLRVRIRNATGAPLGTQAIVRLTQQVGSIQITQATIEAATTEFHNLPMGDYLLEVTAAGYLTANEVATVLSPGNMSQVFIHLRPETAPSAGVASGPPILAPKAQKEVQEALRALEESKLDEAEKHLERAEKLAPGHPEVQYLFGILFARKKDTAAARQRFEKVISIYPQHAAALGGLGRLFLQEGDLNNAASTLERALVADNRSQDNHAILALVLFQQQNHEKARYHAEQALHIAQGKLPETRLLLSQILIALEDKKKAGEILEQFLRDFPEHALAETARGSLTQLRTGSAQPPGAEPTGPAPARPAKGGPEPKRITQAGARVLSLGSLTPELAPGASIPPVREWAPKDVDAITPVIFSDVSCPAETVLLHAGQRVVDLIDHLGDVNAAEKITHTFVDPRGQLGRTEAAKFEYMFSYRRPRVGVIWVEEFRDGSRGSRMVGGVGTSGFAAMALIFHPYYSGDFEMKCEGQGSWQGAPVWYVYFHQREDKPPRMRSFDNVGLRFKGRAWIAANSYEIVRIETDVVAPPKTIRLEREHMVIEYAPVRFKERKQAFWLPSSVDIYAHERGKRWHRNHTLSDYVHFAVDTRQKIADPEKPEEVVKPPQQ